MHPNWIPQKIVLTFIKMYPNLNISSSKFKDIQNISNLNKSEIGPKEYLNNNSNNSLKYTNDSNSLFFEKDKFLIQFV